MPAGWTVAVAVGGGAIRTLRRRARDPASGSVRTMARSRALSERGLAATSAADALRAPRKTS